MHDSVWQWCIYNVYAQALVRYAYHLMLLYGTACVWASTCWTCWIEKSIEKFMAKKLFLNENFFFSIIFVNILIHKRNWIFRWKKNLTWECFSKNFIFWHWCESHSERYPNMAYNDTCDVRAACVRCQFARTKRAFQFNDNGMSLFAIYGTLFLGLKFFFWNRNEEFNAWKNP